MARKYSNFLLKQLMNTNNLFIYIQKRDNNSVKAFLLENGIDIKDEFGRTSLVNSALYNNVELIDWLLDNGADIDSTDNNGYSALHFAAQEANNESLSLLIKKKANINIQDIHGNTPAWVCIMNWKGGGNLTNLKTLYKNGADLTIKNNAGRNAKDIIPEKILSKLKD